MEKHQSLIRHLSTPEGVVRICLESTGLYDLDLVLALHAAGFELMVANPRARLGDSERNATVVQNRGGAAPRPALSR